MCWSISIQRKDMTLYPLLQTFCDKTTNTLCIEFVDHREWLVNLPYTKC